MAHRWSQAGDAAKALPYLLSAAERAGGLFAHHETKHFYNEALRLTADDTVLEGAYARTLPRLFEPHLAGGVHSRCIE
eukprot:2927750-Prymnesium_polylepis.2